MRLSMIAVLCLFCSACADACAEPAAWQVSETQPTFDACDAARDFVRGLEIVDDATIERRVPGELAEIREDAGADGVTDRCWVFLYDADGREVVRLVDFGAPTGADYIHWTLERDGDDVVRARTDLDGDGRFDTESTAGFEDGRYRWSAVDDGIDGIIDARAIFTDDERGRRVAQEHDDGDDGVIDWIEHFAWDDDDRLVRSEWDDGADGDADRVHEYAHIGSVTTSYVERRRTADGWVVDRHRADVDDAGRITFWASDIGDDGVDDTHMRWVYEGSTTTELRDFDANGTVDGRAVTTVDGLTTTFREDFDNDGAWDSIRRQDSDTDGRTITFELLDPATEEPLHRQTSVYAR